MNINLVLLTGLAYTFIGAAIMYVSHRALYRRATLIVAGYPKVLAALRAQRHDGRFGLVVLACGNILQVLAACGYDAPLAHWPIPVYAVLGAASVYGFWRVLYTWLGARRQASSDSGRVPVRRIYESRRSMILLEAARREAEKRRARDLARLQKHKKVIYVGEEWECRWWSERLGVSPEALRVAVREAGPMVRDVERYFARIRQRAACALAA
jgi:hypothetical protein